MTEASPEIPKSNSSRSLRSRYEAVRPTVKRSIEKAFARGRNKSDISAIREGAFYAAEELQEEAYIDTLTELPRRKPFEEEAKKAMAVVDRAPANNKLAISFFDVDDFGVFNKELGEDAGDNVLRMVGKTVKDSVRDTDTAGRIGGEEIAVAQLYKFTANSSTIEGTERIRQNIADIDIPIKDGKIIKHVTASFGTTDYAPGESYKDLMERAGTAMRLAKLFGKNRTVGAILRDDGRLDVTDYQNGNTYIYENEIVDSEDKPGEQEIREYLIDLTEQTRTRIVRDETGRKYKIKIEDVYDEENPMPTSKDRAKYAN